MIFKKGTTEAAKLKHYKNLLLSKRFISPTGCWLWTGALLNNGYGTVSYRNIM